MGRRHKKIFDSSLDQAEKLAQDRLNRNQNEFPRAAALSLINACTGDDFGIFTKKTSRPSLYKNCHNLR